MAKSPTFEFGEFKPDYFVAWNITSQCMNTGNVKIICGGKTLVSTDKSSKSTNLTLLSQGSATLSAGTVVVTVTINEATAELKNSKTGGVILDNTGRKVGWVYDVCIEDSTDDDYNDIYINLVGWGKRAEHYGYCVPLFRGQDPGCTGWLQ